MGVCTYRDCDEPATTVVASNLGRSKLLLDFCDPHGALVGRELAGPGARDHVVLTAAGDRVSVVVYPTRGDTLAAPAAVGEPEPEVLVEVEAPE